MLNILNDKQINNLIKHINKLPRYKTLLAIEIISSPKKTDKDYSINDRASIETWDARIRNHLNIIANVEYLKGKIR